ncbi:MULTISPECIES: DUF4123 domain-containing protein [Halomonas]|uniref:DUF4123 domain-containing protein n=1 Tax=Halomonas TaxID=2745 RepID=UPI001C97764C|nr:MULTISPECIES: DUF4123 domain-containing protein [Halomonas]MBY6207209.1 DUF4123 domain-containing protein [Halomonas sp. DP3Y7-2]MBY6229803.1 DUF4123 domain-containing protein [Halomonas sp. DP3Y7-1]MCA0917865.1 DUF4123 domain-containing protein [Halomonas denitrificans]
MYPTHMQADVLLLKMLAEAHVEALIGYVLVDMSISSSTQRFVLNLHDQKRTRSLFQATPEGAFVHIAPHLIAWNDLTATERDYLIALDQHTPALSWLWVDTDGTRTLYRHLKAQLDMQLPDGGLALLRYYDPCVWQRLMHLLTPEQITTLMGPVHYWGIRLNDQRKLFDRQGRLACFN